MCLVWLDYGIRYQSGSISVTIAISWRGGARGKCLWQSAGSCSIQLPFVAVIAVPTSGKWSVTCSQLLCSSHGELERRMISDSGGCALLVNFHAHDARRNDAIGTTSDEPTRTRRPQTSIRLRRIEDDASEDVSSTIIIMDAAPTLSATSSSDVAGVSAAAPLSSNRATPLPVLVRVCKSQMSHGCHIHHLCMYTYLQPPSFHEQ